MKPCILIWVFLTCCFTSIHALIPSSEEFTELVCREDVAGMKLFFMKLNKDAFTASEYKQFLEEVALQLSVLHNVSLSKLSLQQLPQQLNRYGERVVFGQFHSFGGHCLIRTGLMMFVQKMLHEETLPGDVPIGCVEMLAGALLCVIPNATVRTAGVMLIAHGYQRLTGKLVEVSDRNEERQQ